MLNRRIYRCRSSIRPITVLVVTIAHPRALTPADTDLTAFLLLPAAILSNGTVWRFSPRGSENHHTATAGRI